MDRYGFIAASRRTSSPTRGAAPEPRAPLRTSTVLHLASESPRQRRNLAGRSPSVRHGPSHKVSARSLNTQASSISQRSASRNSLRAATNRLPGYADRRWTDEASDMLTLPPGLADIAEDGDHGGAVAAGLKRKEWERAEKWHRMAHVVRGGGPGSEGMEFHFDPRNAKLIERTWKGIPDRWRAAAWWSFLESAAQQDAASPSAEAVVADFHRLVDADSTDDVQIDMDVPRTVNSHIMFRRRYRGGQRLLFRVLHCLSLYFPETGYVQGMASLAATLLCYFEEGRCFVMLVRMWMLRGLEKLYATGFGGLMHALEEFKAGWLAGGEVEKKLVSLRFFFDLDFETYLPVRKNSVSSLRPTARAGT